MERAARKNGKQVKPETLADVKWRTRYAPMSERNREIMRHRAEMLRVGSEVWLKANKAEGWQRERVTVLEVQVELAEPMLVVECAGDVMEVSVKQVEF